MFAREPRSVMMFCVNNGLANNDVIGRDNRKSQQKMVKITAYF